MTTRNLFPLFLIPGITGMAVSCGNGGAKKNDKPNIILILADDLGYSELGCYGNTFNETPNLDRLAKLGVRFTQAYAAAPVSSPYRAALMTGLYPARTGITDYLRPDAGRFLDTLYTTLPEALRMNGYHTGIIGKWHLSGYVSAKAPLEVLPDKQGFTEVLSSETAGIGAGTYFHPYHFNPALEKILPDEREFLVDRMNKEAVDFIERNTDKPFFLYLSHYAVHTTLHGKPSLVEHFRNKPGSGRSNPSAKNKEDDPYVKWPSDHAAPVNNPHLAAQLKSIDEGVGMIMDKIKQLGIDKNTVIIFTSDNGGETRVTTNSPLREGKSTLYEGGIREPLIICQPGEIAAGRIIDEPVANYDFYPTICEITGTIIPGPQITDGRSILPLLAGKGRKLPGNRIFYWHYPLDKPHFLGGRSSGAIREGDWKLIEFFDTGDIELYNLNNDPGEKENLAGKEREKRDDLLKKIRKWRSEVISEADPD